MHPEKKALIVVQEGNVLLAEAMARLLEVELGFACEIATGSSGRPATPPGGGYALVVIIGEYPLADLPMRLPARLGGAKTAIILPAGAKLSLRQLGALSVDGILVMSLSVAEFCTAIRALLRGRKYLCPDVIENFDSRQPNGKLASLSAKERDLLSLVALGHRNEVIASKLHISTKTVYSYKARIYRKLDLENEVQVLWLLLHQGVVNELSPPNNPHQ